MFEEEKTQIFMNGVTTGRVEILEQLQVILNKGDFPGYFQGDVIELMQRYGYGND